MELTFKEVMSTDGLKVGTHMDKVVQICKKAGFKYFYFNGIIYDENGFETNYIIKLK